MNKVLWTPQHVVSDEQLAELKTLFGDNLHVIALSGLAPDLNRELSNMDPSGIHVLADGLDNVVKHAEVDAVVLPIGSPAFQMRLGYGIAQSNLCEIANGNLEGSLHALARVKILFAHSERVSEDRPDGTKISKFEHKGFFEPLVF